MRKMIISGTLMLVALCGFAQDRYFARTYTSNVLPKGAIDAEFFHTSRFGHEGQFFHAQDQRMEFEIGLGKNVQTAFYFNHYQQRFSTTDNDTETKAELGFSNEWKWRVQQPGRRKPGIALYAEWGLKGGDEIELETKFIIDRWVGKHLIAFNAIVEFEKEFEWVDKAVKSDGYSAPVSFDFAYLYNIHPNLGLGFEICNFNAVSRDNGWENSVLYGGPTLNYRGNRWFVIANYLPQWVNIHKTDIAPFSKVLDTHERAEARIVLGISIF